VHHFECAHKKGKEISKKKKKNLQFDGKKLQSLIISIIETIRGKIIVEITARKIKTE